MLDDFRLRIFVTLSRECSFTKTAIALDVSQPAVSQSVAELEKNLGVRLFDRQRGEVSLTPAGQVFSKYAENILTQYEEAGKVFLPLQPCMVNVCASDDVFAYVCDELLRDFLTVHPEISISRCAAESADIVFRTVPIDKKRGIFALSSDPSSFFAGTDLWKMLSYFLKPTI